MINSFDSLLDAVLSTWSPTISVAAAEDEYVLGALRKAVDIGVCSAIIVGSRSEIERISFEKGISLDGFTIIDVPDKAEACKHAVLLAKEGKTQVVMKGLVDTSVYLRAVLDKEAGIREAPMLSHVSVFEAPTYENLITVSDVALNMYPDVDQKQTIIENSLVVARALEIENPIVACVCAIEKLNPKMPPTVDATELQRRNAEGIISGCQVTGPLALDNALFREAAQHKGITDPLAGRANILLMPNIETGNVLYKSLVHLAKARNAGVVVGAKVPVILTSRSDLEDTKINSIALAIKIALMERTQQ